MLDIGSLEYSPFTAEHIMLHNKFKHFTVFLRVRIQKRLPVPTFYNISMDMHLMQSFRQECRKS